MSERPGPVTAGVPDQTRPAPAGLPAVVGFAVAVGDSAAAVPPPRLAMAGPRLPLTGAGAGPAWTGWVVAGSAGSGALAAAGAQAGFAPARDGDVRVLLAGELYNREELLRALGEDAPATGTDAELLLALWARYGESALRLLNGRYALLLGDGRRLLAAADHAASVPLYLAVRTGPGAGSGGRSAGAVAELRVATEAKALYALGLTPRRVPAGTALRLDLGAADPEPVPLRTWTPPLSRLLLDGRRAVDEVRARLSRAVERRVLGPGAPTVVLSGGIDSSAVAALTSARRDGTGTVTLGTDAADEFAAARLVADHLGTRHEEYTLDAEQLVADLAWAVWAVEITDPDVLEYLLPLVSLYRTLPGPPRRILTGYGADIPLGGMHRDTVALAELDRVLADDMATFDGLNELAPALSGIAGHWTTHPYWDREVLDLLVSLEPGLKRREGTDKWVLREAFTGLLPAETVRRRKLGVHEGTGTSSTWTRLLRESGVPGPEVRQAKQAVAGRLHRLLVEADGHPADAGAAVPV